MAEYDISREVDDISFDPMAGIPLEIPDQDELFEDQDFYDGGFSIMEEDETLFVHPALIIRASTQHWWSTEDEVLQGLTQILPERKKITGLNTVHVYGYGTSISLDMISFIKGLTMSERADVIVLVNKRIAEEMILVLTEVLQPTELIEFLRLLQAKEPTGLAVFAEVARTLSRDKYTRLLEQPNISEIIDALTSVSAQVQGTS